VFDDLAASITSYFSELDGAVGAVLVLGAAWLLMGCVTQTPAELCAGVNCVNYTISASIPPIPSIPGVIPEPTPSPMPSPFTQPSPLLEFYGSADSVKLGSSLAADGRFDFGSNSENLSRAEITLLEDGAQLAGYNVSNGANGLDFAMPTAAIVGRAVGNHVAELSARIFYANGSDYGSLSQAFRFTVHPLEYYQNEQEAYAVNASSKAAQSFTLENAVEVTRIGVYGVKGTGDALQIELCPDLTGAPGVPIVWNNQDDSGAPAQPAWYSIGFNATLAPGKYWIVVTTQGSFDWFADLYGENAGSDSIYRYNGDWLSQTRDKFFKVA